MNNKYEEIIQKRYYHQGNLSFISDKYLILPPSPDDFNEEYYKFTIINLENFSERKISIDGYGFGDEPMIIQIFNDKQYLICQSGGFNKLNGKAKWSIFEEKDNNLVKKEDLKDENILGNNLLFLDDNLIISWNYGDNFVELLSY